MKLALALILLLALASPANATLVPMGDFTRDTETGLDWLRTEATIGLSWDEVHAGAGGWLAAGWRHATPGEVAVLFVGDSLTPPYYGGWILLRIGETAWSAGIDASFLGNSGMYAEIIDGRASIASASVFTSCSPFGAYTCTTSKNIGIRTWSLPLAEGYQYVGHLLVRETPEPGTLALVVLGLAGFAAQRRRSEGAA